MVVEWSSPCVGHVVDFPFDWACFRHRSALCHFPVLWRGEMVLWRQKIRWDRGAQKRDKRTER